MHLDLHGLHLAHYNGGIALVGPSLDSIAACEPRRPHVTLLSPAEYKSLGRPPITQITVPVHYVYVLGPGGKGQVEWLVVVWNHANVWRRNHSLRRKDYHITLTKVDDHEVRKGIGSLSMGMEGLVDRMRELDVDGMDHIAVACGQELCYVVSSMNIKDALTQQARSIAEMMIMSYPSSFNGYIRFAESMSVVDPKLAMLAYAQAASLDEPVLLRVVAKMGKMVELCSYGPTLTLSELHRVPNSLRLHLIKIWPQLQLPTLWTHPTASRERQIYVDRELPRFFSYIYPGRIAGMSTPRNEGDVDTLAAMGFSHILTLTSEKPLDRMWFEAKSIHNVFVPVENWKTPTLAEMDAIYNMIIEGGVWLIHCGGGVGRAGTVLACLIAMRGRGDEDPSDHPKLDAQTAITLLRHARPRSIESEAQEQFVSSWVSHRWKTLHNQISLDEPLSCLEQTHANGKIHDLSVPTVLFLIGKPGSGKSWFTSAIVKRRAKDKTIVISQDDCGSRAMCETQLSREYATDMLVILDRCNPQREDRKLWLALLTRRVIAVYFDYPKDLCLQRINTRLDHPTIRAGRGRNALDQMDSQNTSPQLDEGFSSILTISSFSAAREAIRLLTPDISPLKFPRTPHLLDLGATTDDDILLNDFEVLRGHLTIEEKIDGANMGISLSYEGVLRVQNRSHWVSSSDHDQFKPLDRWIEAHKEALRSILNRDDQYPERYILYGEWMVAKHSILYDSLPDRFIVFDLYDRYEAAFHSRSALTRILAGHGLHQVPLLAETEEVSRKEVLSMLARQSAYSSERVEGVYIRFEDERRIRTVQRGKVVRGDFIAGNEHWSKGRIVFNRVLHEH